MRTRALSLVPALGSFGQLLDTADGFVFLQGRGLGSGVVEGSGVRPRIRVPAFDTSGCARAAPVSAPTATPATPTGSAPLLGRAPVAARTVGTVAVQFGFAGRGRARRCGTIFIGPRRPGFIGPRRPSLIDPRRTCLIGARRTAPAFARLRTPRGFGWLGLARGLAAVILGRRRPRYSSRTLHGPEGHVG
jgi:hypothetical protein